MGERAHTKGPWSVRRSAHKHDGAYDYAINAGDALVLAEAFGRDAVGRHPNAEANAYLIAAAPDMFEAIEEAHSQAVMLLLAIVEGDPSSELQLRVNDMLEVLAKASASASSGRNLADAHKNPLPGEIAP